jgi:hypothetical protein
MIKQLMKVLPKLVFQSEDHPFQGNAEVGQKKHLRHQFFNEFQVAQLTKSKYHQPGSLESIPGSCPDQDQQWWPVLIARSIPKTTQKTD